MQGINYGLITADEWLNQASDTNEFLRESGAQVIRSTGYQGNSKFFVLVNIPEDTLFLNFDALDWAKAPKGADTEIQDVVPASELERGVLHPVEEALESAANTADEALQKASKVGLGLGVLVGLPLAAYFGFQIISILKSKKD